MRERAYHRRRVGSLGRTLWCEDCFPGAMAAPGWVCEMLLLLEYLEGVWDIESASKLGDDLDAALSDQL